MLSLDTPMFSSELMWCSDLTTGSWETAGQLLTQLELVLYNDLVHRVFRDADWQQAISLLFIFADRSAAQTKPRQMCGFLQTN